MGVEESYLSATTILELPLDGLSVEGHEAAPEAVIRNIAMNGSAYRRGMGEVGHVIDMEEDLI